MIIAPADTGFIQEACGGKWSGPQSQATIHRVLIDSRHPFDPIGSLFVALRTDRGDGHAYIPELIKKGCTYFLVDHIPEGLDGVANFLLVDDTLKALHQWAAIHRNQFSIPVVAITGSNGKTVVKEWLFHLLKEQYFIVRSPKSFNSQIGVPLSVLQMHASHQVAIFEVGISHPGDMEPLQRIVQPTLGILTNIGMAHVSNFKDRTQLIEEKLKLFTGCEHVVIQEDATDVMDLAKRMHLTCVPWSPQKTSTYHYEPLKDGRYKFAGHELNQAFRFQFNDETSLQNIFHCLVAADLLQADHHQLVAQAETVVPVHMRLEVLQGVNDCLIVNDTYNLDLTSLQIALEFLARQKGNLQKTVILSELYEYAVSPEKDLKEVAAMLIRNNVNTVYLIGEGMRPLLNYFHGNLMWFESVDEFMREVQLNSFEQEAILVKGSRLSGFDRVVSWLQKKTHVTRLEVDLEAVVHNLNHYRSKIPAGCKVLVMVKAFGYGSGSEDLAATLEFNRVDYLAVAYPDEGIALRQSGIKTPILVMNPMGASMEMLARFQLEPEIYSLEFFREVVQRCAHLSNPMKVHIKFDSGMHRLGFQNKDLEELCALISSTEQIEVASVFTHLSAADDPQMDALTKKQIEQFEQAYDRISKVTGPRPIKHVLNSAGIERHAQYAFDMVRLGIGLHGIGSTVAAAAQLTPVNTFRSVITQVKKVKAGEIVGYGGKNTLEKDTWIAIIPVGYADGYPRSLGNGKGKMLVNGMLAPVVGNVCMDMTMIDVTGIHVREGQEVILFGRSFPIQEVALWANTIPYELLAGVSSRVKRVYVQGL